MIRNTVHWKDEMFPIGEGSKEDSDSRNLAGPELVVGWVPHQALGQGCPLLPPRASALLRDDVIPS